MPRPTGIAMTASIPCVAIVAGGRGCDVSGANRLVRVIRDREPARRPQPGGRMFGHDLTAYAFWSADDADAARLHLEAIGRSVTALPRAAPVSPGRSSASSDGGTPSRSAQRDRVDDVGDEQERRHGQEDASDDIG